MADILTKPLSEVKFVYFKDKLNMAKNASLAKREHRRLRQHCEPLSQPCGYWLNHEHIGSLGRMIVLAMSIWAKPWVYWLPGS